MLAPTRIKPSVAQPGRCVLGAGAGEEELAWPSMGKLRHEGGAGLW